MSTALTYY